MAHEAYVPAHLIPRTDKQRKKNWRCVFPGCSETPKTKHNCLSHVWDVHLRRSPDTLERCPQLVLTAYNDSPQKPDIKRLCLPFMQKLVARAAGRQEFPFAFRRDASALLRQLLNPAAQRSPPPTPPSGTHSATPPSSVRETPPDLSSEDSSRCAADIISIRKIHEGVRQLHVYGEVLAEYGFFVRSDERAKTNIQAINDALYGVMRLVGRQYQYVLDETPRFGFVAQDVQQVLPEVVHVDAQGLLSVDVIQLIPLVVEALKAIAHHVEELQGKAQDDFRCLKNTVSETLAQLEHLGATAPPPLPPQPTIHQHLQHAFGPTLLLVLAALLLTIAAVVMPLITRQLLLVETAVVCVVVALWGFVITNRREIVRLVFRRSPPKALLQREYIGPVQVFVWSLVSAVVIVGVMLTVVLGVLSVIVAVMYGVCFLSVFFICVIVALHTTSKHRTLLVFLGMVAFHCLALVILASIAFLQPFQYFSLQTTTVTSLQCSVNASIAPVVLPTLPWNCLDPTFTSQPPLPTSLALTFNTSVPFFSTPLLTGTLANPLQETSYIFASCAAVTFNYTTLILRSL